MTQHALIIEDDETSRFMLQELFANYFPEHEVHVMNDSCDYQQRLASIEAPLELAIIDIYLSTCPPGNVVMQWMREQSQFKETKMIAFTADSLMEGKGLLKEGFDAVIIKPVQDTATFVAQIYRVMEGQSFIYNG
jgi:CheY-like chemotaxis protein